MRIQVTLYDKKNRYRPVSTLVKVPDLEYFKTHREEVKNNGVKKIMMIRGWTKRELITYNYLTCKMRVYSEED